IDQSKVAMRPDHPEQTETLVADSSVTGKCPASNASGRPNPPADPATLQPTATPPCAVGVPVTALTPITKMPAQVGGVKVSYEFLQPFHDSVTGIELAQPLTGTFQTGNLIRDD